MSVMFSILVMSYNRHELVRRALQSVISQTFQNFEILLVDNGSSPSLDLIVHEFNFKRLHYFRYDTNTHTSDVANEILQYIKGTHFLFLADDDALTPTALERVATIFEAESQIEAMGVGFVHFNHDSSNWNMVDDDLGSFTRSMNVYNGEHTAVAYCNGQWGIGKTLNFPMPRMAHSSGIFISKGLIEKTVAAQGGLFIKPFGDIGFLGSYANTLYIYYLDLPLVIIGETGIREMNGSKPGQRYKWNKEVQFLEYTPLKAPSFINMGTDAHLKVMFRNHLNNKYDCRLRPDFYWRHLKDVFSDSPWTVRTVLDIWECLPRLLMSHYQFSSPIDLLRFSKNISKQVWAMPQRILRKILSISFRQGGKIVQSSTTQIKFANINVFAEWLDTNYIETYK